MRILRSKFHRPKSNTVFARVAEYHTSGIALASPPVVSATNVLMDRTTANVGVGDRLLEKQSDRIDSSFQYGAISTPTVEAVANSIAILEGGKGALLTPSGQSSLFLVISTISRRGGTLLVSDSLTYSTLNLLNELACRLGFRLRRLGVREVSKVTVDELVADSTFCVLLEAPGGFDYEIPDIKKVFEVAKQAQVKCVFDNTWSSSVCFCPIKFGADVVILSLSKCYGGTWGSVVDLIKASICRLCEILNFGRYARFYFIVREGIPYLLEVNTLPGLNAQSVFVKACLLSGVGYDEMICRIIGSSKV